MQSSSRCCQSDASPPPRLGSAPSFRSHRPVQLRTADGRVAPSADPDGAGAGAVVDDVGAAAVLDGVGVAAVPEGVGVAAVPEDVGVPPVVEVDGDGAAAVVEGDGAALAGVEAEGEAAEETGGGGAAVVLAPDRRADTEPMEDDVPAGHGQVTTEYQDDGEGLQLPLPQ